MKPKGKWLQMEAVGKTDPNLVWISYLDQRYQLEVHRTGQTDYDAVLYMWDHSNGDLLVHSQGVSLSYGAKFGPDQADINAWCAAGITVADKIAADETNKTPK